MNCQCIWSVWLYVGCWYSFSISVPEGYRSGLCYRLLLFYPICIRPINGVYSTTYLLFMDSYSTICILLIGQLLFQTPSARSSSNGGVLSLGYISADSGVLEPYVNLVSNCSEYGSPRKHRTHNRRFPPCIILDNILTAKASLIVFDLAIF